MAVDLINRNDSLLENYNLQLEFRDTQCKSDLVMKAYMEFVLNDSQPIAGILGELGARLHN